MSGKQNIIFFLLASLLFFSFYSSGDAMILWEAAFRKTPVAPNKDSVKPVKGKCPKGFFLLDGKCIEQNLGV
jgi:hypothetical protein